jgi:hypothetical protein
VRDPNIESEEEDLPTEPSPKAGAKESDKYPEVTVEEVKEEGDQQVGGSYNLIIKKAFGDHGDDCIVEDESETNQVAGTPPKKRDKDKYLNFQDGQEKVAESGIIGNHTQGDGSNEADDEDNGISRP